MNEENIAKIVLAYLNDIVKSWKVQITAFIVCVILLLHPNYLHLSSRWLSFVEAISRIIVLSLPIFWVIQFFVYLAKKRNRKSQILKLLQDIITGQNAYSNYENNNLIYTAYVNKLNKFTFHTICNHKEEMDLYTTNDTVEEILNDLQKDRIIQYKKGKYIFPKYIWKELEYFYKSKQLRKKS